MYVCTRNIYIYIYICVCQSLQQNNTVKKNSSFSGILTFTVTFSATLLAIM